MDRGKSIPIRYGGPPPAAAKLKHSLLLETTMNMKLLFLALMALASVQMHAQADSTEIVSATQTPVDFSKPVDLEIEIEIPNEHTSIEKLSKYLDQNGFSLHIRVAYKQSSEELELQKKQISACKSGTVHAEEFNAISTRVSELVMPFGGNSKWTIRQQRKGN